MRSDDPRHGSRAGYIAGCRDECCRPHHLHYQKRSSFRRHREGTQIVDASKVLTRIAWWDMRGVGRLALANAARISEGALGELVSGERTVCLKSTRRAVLAVTWDDLPDNALVYAELTRLRIFSMNAAGHTIRWIAENSMFNTHGGGNWRTRERTSIGLARSIQTLYELAPDEGPNRQVAAKARNYGHPIPAAWDDPGLPAMPKGWAPEIEQRERLPFAQANIRAAAERRAALIEDVEWLADSGVSLTDVERRLGKTRHALQKRLSEYGRSDLYRRLAAGEAVAS